MLGLPTYLRRASVALLVVSVGATAGCVGDRPTLASEPEAMDTSPGETTSTVPGAPARVAQAKADSIDLFDDATAAAPRDQITAAEATAAPDIPIVFLVKSKKGDRLEVYLPVPPAGSTAWVDAADVSVSSVSFHIEVSLRAHRLRVFEGDDVVVEEPASIGTAEAPAPGAVYFIKELLQPPDPDGPYGSYAYGLSGFTTQVSSFDKGTGVIGIHGTDDPDSIGKNVDSGCIGLMNDVLDRLVDDIGLPLGTPVEILR